MTVYNQPRGVDYDCFASLSEQAVWVGYGGPGVREGVGAADTREAREPTLALECTSRAPLGPWVFGPALGPGLGFGACIGVPWLGGRGNTHGIVI